MTTILVLYPFYGLAAGRGFIHVSSSGDLEPCPAATFSDTNLSTVPLRDALRSSFLAIICLHHDLLPKTNGGCALWTNRDRAQTLLTEPRAPENVPGKYQTDRLPM